MKSFLFAISILFGRLGLTQVSIGTTTPSASTALVYSTNKGFSLFINSLQVQLIFLAIASVAVGLIVHTSPLLEQGLLRSFTEQR